MFLNKLDNRQKELFIQLSLHASLANSDIHDEQSVVIDQYCKEMEIMHPGFTPRLELDLVLSGLAEISTEEERNIIVFETLALVVSDNEYDLEEQSFVEKLLSAFGVDEAKAETMLRNIAEYKLVCQKIIETL